MATGGGEDFNMSDELVINKCCVCAKKSKRTEAEKYCVDCLNYYCSSCADVHMVIPHMEGHTLCDKNAFKSFRSDGKLPSFPTQRCSIHLSKVVDMFCQDHDEVACASCIALDHRSCTRIHSVPENVNNLYERSEVINIKQNIALNQKSLEDTTKSKEAKVKQLKGSLNISIDSVKTFCQELKCLLDKIEHLTIVELKREFDRIQTFLTKEIKGAEYTIDELKKAASQLRNAEENKVQEFIYTKASRKLILIAKEEMKNYHSQPEENISFTADHSIKSFLQNIKVFGEVKCNKRYDMAAKPSLTVKLESPEKNLTLPKGHLYKVTTRRKIDLKLPYDISDCHINDSCITQDGYLLLADSNNKKLKRVDLSTETVRDHLSFFFNPRAVCQVSKIEAAVGLINNTVQFVRLGDRMTATKRIRSFNHACESLAYINGNLFSCEGGNEVFIHDIYGKELRKITTDASGEDIFERTEGIAVGADGGRVFVTDYDKGLITLDIHGNYLSTLSANKIQASSCVGLCADSRNVFICGFGSDNVVQIRQDYKLIGQIQRVDKPLSLCFSSQTCRLYVTKAVFSKDGGNTVLVLELA